MVRMQLLGNVGKPATVNSFNGRNVINFFLATSERWRDAGGVEHEKTRWVECSLWRDSTTIAQYLQKGTKVFVEGVPDVKTFQKQDGTFVASQTLKVTYIQLLGGNKDGQQQQEQPPITYTGAGSEKHDDSDGSDLPF